MKQTKKEEKKKKKEKKSEVEYRYIKLPMIFDGHIVYNYCTIMDYNSGRYHSGECYKETAKLIIDL
jgi:hypothetical protein